VRDDDELRVRLNWLSIRTKRRRLVVERRVHLVEQQNGLGFVRKMPNSSDSATSARSPLDRRWMRWDRFPRGLAWISMSQSSGWSGRSSRRSHSPPPNSVMKIWRKFSRACANVARNSSRAVVSISLIACCSDARACARSLRCP
jgi:hypothetical protein